MRKPANDLPEGGPSGEVVPEAVPAPTPPPSFPPATAPPKRVPLPQSGGSYRFDETAGAAVLVERTKLPDEAAANP